MGARLRYHLCMTCNRIARISIFGTSESSNQYLIPETPDRHYPDCQPQRCKTCTTHSPGGAVDYAAMYNIIPASLARSIRLSYKAQRYITVDCECLLHCYGDQELDLLAAKIQRSYPANTIVNAKHLRGLIYRLY